MKALSGLLTVLCVAGILGVCGAQDKLIEAEAIPLVPKGVITLTEGWNLVAMPVLPCKPYSVRQFIKDVEVSGKCEAAVTVQTAVQRPYWKVLKILVVKDGCFKELINKNKIPYNMVPGEAYFAQLQYLGPRPVPVGTLQPVPADTLEKECVNWYPQTSVSIAGRRLNHPIALNLNAGQNGVSVPRTDATLIVASPLEEKMYSVNQLSKDLIDQGIKAASIAFWSATEQEWVAYKLPFTEKMLRFIRPDEGFILTCEENGLLVPGLKHLVPAPVYVKEKGRVEFIPYQPGKPYPYHFLLHAENGGNIPMKSRDTDIERELEQASADGLIRLVEGVMRTVIYKGDGGFKQVSVLIVDRVTLVEEEPVWVEYTGRIQGILVFPPENDPPYDYVLIRTTTHVPAVPLMGCDEEMEQRLARAAGGTFVVGGYMRTITYEIGTPPETEEITEDVLIVHQIDSH